MIAIKGRVARKFTTLLPPLALEQNSDTYHPESKPGKTITRFSFGLSSHSENGANVAKEFAPDLSCKLGRESLRGQNQSRRSGCLLIRSTTPFRSGSEISGTVLLDKLRGWDN
jgi:hypothetical protein